MQRGDAPVERHDTLIRFDTDVLKAVTPLGSEKHQDSLPQ